MGDPARETVLFNSGSGTRTLDIPLSSREVHDLLRDAGTLLGATTDPPDLADVDFETIDETDDGLEQRIARFAELSCCAWNRLRQNPKVVRDAAILKALLISADVAGSASLRIGSRHPNGSRVRSLSASPARFSNPIINEGDEGREAAEVSRGREGLEKVW